jgi:hypothetical protein
MLAFPKKKNMSLDEYHKIIPAIELPKLMYSKGDQVRKSNLKERVKKEFRDFKGSERELNDLCEEYLEACGLTYIRVPDAIYKAIFGFGGDSIPIFIKKLISSFIKGIPDFTVLMDNGKYVCIELKVGRNDLSQGQKKFAEKVKVHVVRSYEEFKKIIDDVEK